MQWKIKKYIGNCGVLVLCVIEGDLKRDTEFIGNMDPFVVVNYDNQ